MKLCDRKDAAIVPDPATRERLLYDCDGDLLFRFPGPDEWTDEQMLTALDFANQAFERGLSSGRADKAFEVRKALGLI